MQVRAALEPDRPAVLAVVRAAFDGGDDEVGIVEQVWGSADHLPQLDLVADADGEIVGHVLLSAADLGGRPSVGLAPLAVVPARQGEGVGGSLVTEALRRADAAGHPLVVLLGHPGYYARFGFEAARPLGIDPPVALDDDAAFMVRRLRAYDDSCRGRFRYASAFGADWS